MSVIYQFSKNTNVISSSILFISIGILLFAAIHSCYHNSHCGYHGNVGRGQYG